MTVTVGALKETAPGETRVAVTPASVQRLRASGIDVLVERDAGAGALLPARTYTDVGARVVDAELLLRRADAVLAIHAPDAPRRAQLRRGQLLCGLLQACTTIELVADIDIELHTNPKTRMYFADAKQALSANHVRDQDPRRLRSTTSKTVAKNRRELKEETRWHTRPSTRTTTR